MHKFSIKKAFSVAKTEYIKWVFNPRMIIILIMLVFIKTSAVQPLLDRMIKLDEPINIFEPFIALGNSMLIVLVVPLVFLTLISDFPRTDGNTIFFISRTGKANWLTGQIIFFFIAIISFFVIIFAGSVLPVIFDANFDNQWSDVVTKYHLTFPEEQYDAASYLIKGNLYNQMSPVIAAVQTYIIMMMHMFLMALIMLLFNIYKKKIFGFITVGALIAVGFALSDLNSDLMWFTPLANSIVWEHFTEMFRKPVKPMSDSYLYFGILSAILIVVNFIGIRKFSLETIQEVD